jgi:hypothetical protein
MVYKKNINTPHIDGALISPSLIQAIDGSLPEPPIKIDQNDPIPN